MENVPNTARDLWYAMMLQWLKSPEALAIAKEFWDKEAEQDG